MTRLDTLCAQLRLARDPRERAEIASVIDDAHIEAGRPPSSRRVCSITYYTHSFQAAHHDSAGRDAIGESASDTVNADDSAPDTAQLSLFNDAAHKVTGEDMRDGESAGSASTTPTEWIDMLPGLYIIQWSGTYGRAITAIAHCRVEGDWVRVADGHRTLWTSGTRSLVSLAAEGPRDDHSLSEPSPVPRWIPSSAILAIGPIPEDTIRHVWKAYIEAPKQ